MPHGSCYSIYAVSTTFTRYHLPFDAAEEQRQIEIHSNSFKFLKFHFQGVYFVKRLPIEVPRDDCASWLISGDLATRSIDQLSCLVDEIFVPLLSNTDNHNVSQ